MWRGPGIKPSNVTHPCGLTEACAIRMGLELYSLAALVLCGPHWNHFHSVLNHAVRANRPNRKLLPLKDHWDVLGRVFDLLFLYTLCILQFKSSIYLMIGSSSPCNKTGNLVLQRGFVCILNDQESCWVKGLWTHLQSGQPTKLTQVTHGSKAVILLPAWVDYKSSRTFFHSWGKNACVDSKFRASSLRVATQPLTFSVP